MSEEVHELVVWEVLPDVEVDLGPVTDARVDGRHIPALHGTLIINIQITLTLS
jgi:hypothetical protein